MAEKFDIAAFLHKAEEWKDLANYEEAEVVYTYWSMLIAERKENGDLVFLYKWPKIPRSREEAIEWVNERRNSRDYPNHVYVVVKHEIDRWDFEWVTYYEIMLTSALIEVSLTDNEERDEAFFTGEFGYIHNREISYHDIVTRFWTIECCEDENGVIVWKNTESATFKNIKKELLQMINYPAQYENDDCTVWVFACHKITRDNHDRTTFYKLSFDGTRIIKEKVKVVNYGVKPDYRKKKPQA